MKRSLLVTVLALLAGTSCHSTGKHMNDHWSIKSVAPRAARYVLGYDAAKDGPYRDFQWRRKQDINLTLRRHLLNQNPDNPNHPEWPGRFEARPNHSLLPNPVNYIHLEGVLLGLVTWGAGSFVPIPVDSILGTLEKGGVGEFVDGVGEFFVPLGVVTTSLIYNFVPGAERKPMTRVTELER